jgi:hypothetical protein
VFFRSFTYFEAPPKPVLLYQVSGYQVWQTWYQISDLISDLSQVNIRSRKSVPWGQDDRKKTCWAARNSVHSHQCCYIRYQVIRYDSLV